MTLLGVAVALAAAVAFGWSTAAMHYDASSAPPAVQGPVALVRHLAGQWRWLTGMAASLLGLGLHAVALRIGSLSVVQPLVVTGLVAALLFRAALERRRPDPAVLGWACLTAAGLAVFLAAAGSTTGSATPSGAPAAIILAAGAVAACVCWRAARRARPGGAGLLLGGGTGIVFGLTAGTLKATSDEHGLVQVLTSWPLYVLLVLGLVGFLANQVTYRRTSLASSLPLLNVANPVVALAYGVLAFGERPGRRPAGYLVEGLALTAVLLGVYFLARRPGRVPHGRPAVADDPGEQPEPRVLVRS